MNEEQRFWSKVDKRGPDECWEWQGGKSVAGYGRFWLNGKTVSSTHFAYSSTGRSIRPGYFICHSCDNPGCVNPSHLFQGTPKENQMDMIKKGRQVNTRRKRENYTRGEMCHLSKLTQSQVKEMRSLYAARKMTTNGLSKNFSVSKSTAKKIISNSTWKDDSYVPPERWGRRKKHNDTKLF